MLMIIANITKTLCNGLNDISGSHKIQIFTTLIATVYVIFNSEKADLMELS